MCPECVSVFLIHVTHDKNTWLEVSFEKNDQIYQLVFCVSYCDSFTRIAIQKEIIYHKTARHKNNIDAKPDVT